MPTSDYFGGAVGAFLRSQEEQAQQRELDRATSILGALEEARVARRSGKVSTPEFERQAVERGILKPEETKRLPATEHGLPEVDLSTLTPDSADAQILNILGPGNNYDVFAKRIQDIKIEDSIQSLIPFISKATGADEGALRESGLTGIQTTLAIMKALPKTGARRSPYQALKIVGPGGKPIYGLLNKDTGEIEETDVGAIAGSSMPVFDVQYDENGHVISQYYGPLEGKLGPGAAALNVVRSRRVAGFEKKKTAARTLINSITRAQELVSEGMPRGRAGALFQGIESATNQLAASAKALGGVPALSQVRMPDSIEHVAASNQRIRTIAYNLAVALARFHDPESTNLSSRQIERELEYEAGYLIGGSDVQSIAGLSELTNSILRELANEANDLGLTFDIEAKGTPKGIEGQPTYPLSPEASEGAAMLEKESGIPFSKGAPPSVGPTEVYVNPASLPSFNPKGGTPTRLRFNYQTKQFEPVPPEERAANRERGRRETTIGVGE